MTQATTTHLVLPAGAPWRDLLPRTQTQVAWRRLALPMSLLVAVGLSLPTLGLGFFLDDYVMLGLIEERFSFDTPMVNLYASFMDAINVWWKSPDAHFAFWRPLTSALIRLDHFLFGHDAFFYHVQLLLGLAALIAVCHRLYQRDFSPAIAGSALLILAVDESHAYTSGTICNGHTIVSLVPALLGLLAYLRWRESGWRPGAGLALLGFAVGLLGGETAFAVMAYPLSYEVFAAAGPVKKRLRAMAPLAVLGIAYVGFYRAMDLGPGQIGSYLNPLEQPPAELLSGLSVYLPIYLTNLLAAVPTDLGMKEPNLLVPVLIAGATLPLLLFVGWRKVRDQLSRPNRKALSWWVPGALGALLPMAFAPPSERQLLPSAIGIAPLLASFLVVSWHTWSHPRTYRRPRWNTVAAMVLLLGLHLGVAPWNRVRTQQEIAQLSATLEAQAARIHVITGSTDPGIYAVILVNGSFMTSYYVPRILAEKWSPTPWGLLSNAPYKHRLTRSGTRTLLLEPVGGAMLHTPPERMVLTAGEKLSVGETFRTELFTAEILQHEEEGPTQVAYHFDRDLDDPALVLLAWESGRLTRLSPPAVGESVLLPPARRLRFP